MQDFSHPCVDAGIPGLGTALAPTNDSLKDGRSSILDGERSSGVAETSVGTFRSGAKHGGRDRGGRVTTPTLFVRRHFDVDRLQFDGLTLQVVGARPPPSGGRAHLANQPLVALIVVRQTGRTDVAVSVEVDRNRELEEGVVVVERCPFPEFRMNDDFLDTPPNFRRFRTRRPVVIAENDLEQQAFFSVLVLLF